MRMMRTKKRMRMGPAMGMRMGMRMSSRMSMGLHSRMSIGLLFGSFPSEQQKVPWCTRIVAQVRRRVLTSKVYIFCSSLALYIYSFSSS